MVIICSLIRIIITQQCSVTDTAGIFKLTRLKFYGVQECSNTSILQKWYNSKHTELICGLERFFSWEKIRSSKVKS